MTGFYAWILSALAAAGSAPVTTLAVAGLVMGAVGVVVGVAGFLATVYYGRR